MRSLLGVLNQLAAEFSFSTPSAPPSTYTFKLNAARVPSVGLYRVTMTAAEAAASRAAFCKCRDRAHSFRGLGVFFHRPV
jgi:hypothetical protein